MSGGCQKDRVAKRIIEDAEAQGLLKVGGTVIEGNSGSTGISLSLMCRARGYKCVIVMPDDQVTPPPVRVCVCVCARACARLLPITQSAGVPSDNWAVD